MGILKSLFGVKASAAPEAVVSAAVSAAVNAPCPPPPARHSSGAPDFVECTDRRFFEILETFHDRTPPLHDLVTWNTEEEEQLKKRRVEAYQLRNGTDYKPRDVFHLWPYHAVDCEHVIKQVELKKDAPTALPEYSQIMHVHVVSDRVMKAITALEVERHAFFPLEIAAPGSGTSYRYHFMQFLEHTDCTVPKLGGFREGVCEDGPNFWVRASTNDKVFLDMERVGTRHLFFDKRGKSGCFISGELANELGDFLPRGYYLAEAGLVRRRLAG